MTLEAPDRIEPALLHDAPTDIMDVVAELASKTATLGKALHPKTASNLADLVRIMNTYYSNLMKVITPVRATLKGALSGQLDSDQKRRDLQLEAKAHVRVQAEVDKQFREGTLSDPTSTQFLRFLHREFYRDAPVSMLLIKAADREFVMQPGEWRSLPEDEVQVGQHLPPSSDRVPDFMRHFEVRYRQQTLGPGSCG